MDPLLSPGEAEPLREVLLVGVVEAGHVARVGAVGDLADGVNQVEGNYGPVGVVPDLLVVNDLLGGQYQALGGHGELPVLDCDAVYLGVAVHVAPVDVHEDEVGVAGGEEAEGLTCEGVLHHAGGALAEGVGAQHYPGGDEGEAHGGRLEPPLEAGVGDLPHHPHRASLHGAAAGGGEAPELVAEAVGALYLVDDSAADEDIDVVDRRLGRHGEVAPSLAYHLVDGGHAHPDVAEAPEGEVVTVSGEAPHCLAEGHALVPLDAALVIPHPAAGLVGVHPAEELPLSFGYHLTENRGFILKE